jgi:low-density lipoprotein receptor-related protein 1 (alpha-2-macroglobulin receptor)
MALDPINGRIYYISWPLNNADRMYGQVRSAGMDGSNDTGLTEYRKYLIRNPNGLTLDFVERKLYWADYLSSTVYRMNLDGSKVENVRRGGAKDFFPMSIAFFNQFIYFTDKLTNNIRRMNLKEAAGNSSFETLSLEKAIIWDMKVFDNRTQVGTNACSTSKCPGICLISPNGPVCSCPDGSVLSANDNRCLQQVSVNGSAVLGTGCNVGMFECVTTIGLSHCVDQKYLCDGEPDCKDGSDEKLAPDGPCSPTCDLTANFSCDGSRCISRSLLCDKTVHCVDETDEDPVNCPNMTCSENQFQCLSTKKCIPLTWVCDKHQDCGPNDSSDEPEQCGKCEDFECHNKVCIPFEYLCDGINNCGDNSDEQDCDVDCKPSEFFCPSFGCLDRSQVCDGIVDCLEGNDEANCTNVTIVASDNKAMKPSVFCTSQEFSCANGIECVAAYYRCDGVNDCLDKSDEDNCKTIKQRPTFNETTICDHPDRLCKVTNKCIRVDQLCDGRTDCPDKSDEGFRCKEKLCDHNTQCSYYCHNAPEGIVCSCPLHLYLQPDGYRCSREHACEHWGTCAQGCEQRGKRYTCKCQEGYTLQYDYFSCKSNAKDSPLVIFR